MSRIVTLWGRASSWSRSETCQILNRFRKTMTAIVRTRACRLWPAINQIDAAKKKHSVLNSNPRAYSNSSSRTLPTPTTTIVVIGKWIGNRYSIQMIAMAGASIRKAKGRNVASNPYHLSKRSSIRSIFCHQMIAMTPCARRKKSQIGSKRILQDKIASASSSCRTFRNSTAWTIVRCLNNFLFLR